MHSLTWAAIMGSGGGACVGQGDVGTPCSAQLCCEPKTRLKNNLLGGARGKGKGI